jgi:hypothetical protein
VIIQTEPAMFNRSHPVASTLGISLAYAVNILFRSASPTSTALADSHAACWFFGFSQKVGVSISDAC